jgi:hypothetical protein
MGVSRYQQTLAEKGLHMGAPLTRVRVESCLQQGTSEAERLGVQGAIVIDGTVVGAGGVSGGIPADLDHAMAEAAVRAG